MSSQTIDAKLTSRRTFLIGAGVTAVAIPAPIALPLQMPTAPSSKVSDDDDFVRPADAPEISFSFRPKGWMSRVDIIIAEHKEAKAELEDSCCDEIFEPTATKAAVKRWNRASDTERATLLALCETPAFFIEDRTRKAQYLLEFEARNSLEPAHVRAILNSLIASPNSAGDAA